ncbi:MAG TPA: GAF domain-containing sensor histidine kinase [Anaeromyxobacteraceae bacterium]|nr:GAF domain-containing sensor histidine kinase [Anaeromyxobacteraceae bacterium]
MQTGQVKSLDRELGLGADAELLVEAARSLAAAHDLPSLMAVTRRAARALVSADGVTFVLREGAVVHYADEDAIAPLWKGRRFPAEACISGWAMIHRQPVVIEDVDLDDRIPHDVYRQTFVKSLLMVPVRPEEPVAAIGAYWAERRRASAREVRLIETLAGLTSVALSNAALVAELKQAVQLRDEFLGVASHELRTPLTALRLHIQRARRALAPAASPLEPVLAVLDHHGARLTRLVERLVDASRFEARAMALEPEELDLAALAKEVVERFAGTPELRLDAPAPVRGRWDRSRLDQILENLVSNAVKFGEGKQVDVEVAAMPGGARLTVRDRGIGIDPADQGRIFERFGRAVPARSYGGFGLGLWLVRQDAEALGGTVALESAPGHGARFTVTLPG